MPAEDEFRKVAEDVRELARALRSELRAAKWEAKDAARQARRDFRSYYRSGEWPTHGYPGPNPWWQGQPPAWGAAPPDADTAETAGGGQPGPAAAGAPGSPASGPGPAAAVPPHGGRTGYGPVRGSWGAPPGQRPRFQRPGAPPSWGWGPPGPPGRGVAAPPVRPPRPPKPARPPKSKLPPIRHRRDGSTLLSVLLVLVGLAWLASETGIFTVSLEAVLATALVVLGASMVVTARTDWSLSRRHWPVWVGMGVLVVLLVSANGSAIQDSLSSLHFGPVSTTPTAWRDVGGTISNLAGPIDLDLTHLPASGATSANVRVRDTFGPIQVTIPASPSYRLEIRARTAFGPVNLPDQPASAGTFSTKEARYGSTDPKAPVVDLVLNDVFGPVNVVQQQ